MPMEPPEVPKRLAEVEALNLSGDVRRAVYFALVFRDTGDLGAITLAARHMVAAARAAGGLPAPVAPPSDEPPMDDDEPEVWRSLI